MAGLRNKAGRSTKKALKQFDGFTLVEVVCALAILFIAVLPLYQAGVHGVRLQKRAELQLTANNLAQAEMERLKHAEGITQGVQTFPDPVTNRLYVETRVEPLSSELFPTLPDSGRFWLEFKEIQTPIEENVTQVRIFDRLGNARGSVLAKTLPPHEGLVFVLNENNTIDFNGITSLRLEPSVLQELGIDLSVPGTDSSNIKIYCTGTTAEPLDFYFDLVADIPKSPGYLIEVTNHAERLKFHTWPGKNPYIDLKVTEGKAVNEIWFKGFVFSVKVFESREIWQAGGTELIKLQSVRHDILQAGE